MPSSTEPLADRAALKVTVDAPPDGTGWGRAAGLRYLELVPDGAKPSERMPLLIVIHGLGDRPDPSWLESIDVEPGTKVRMILPQAPLPYGAGFAWFRQRAATREQTALGRGIAEAERRVAALIEVVRKQRPTRGKAVVTGFSQGGMLSFALALRHPQLLELAVPISGMLPEVLWPVRGPAAGGAPPIRALHGTEDARVRFAVTQPLIARLRELGYDAELTAFEATGHEISPPMASLVRTTLTSVLARMAPGSAPQRRPAAARERNAIGARAPAGAR